MELFFKLKNELQKKYELNLVIKFDEVFNEIKDNSHNSDSYKMEEIEKKCLQFLHAAVQYQDNFLVSICLCLIGYFYQIRAKQKGIRLFASLISYEQYDDFLRAMFIYNACENLLENECYKLINIRDFKDIFKKVKMELVEIFIKIVSDISLFNNEFINKLSNTLYDMREDSKSMKLSYGNQQIKRFFESCTKSYINIIREMFEKCLDVVNKDTKEIDYAILGLGSISRKEVTPYSDLEFIILIKPGQLEAESILYTAAQLMYLLVLSLNESLVPNELFGDDILENKMKSIKIKRGFAFDISGRTPLGMRYLYNKKARYKFKLLGDVDHILKYMIQENSYINDYRAQSEFGQFVLIKESKLSKLETEYKEKLSEHIKMNNVHLAQLIISLQKLFKFEKVQEKLKHQSMVIKESEIIFKDMQQSISILAKHHIYRPYERLIDTMFLLSDNKISSNNDLCISSLDKIEELRERGHINDKTATLLSNNFCRVLMLRLEIYSHYHGQQEVIVIPDKSLHIQPILYSVIKEGFMKEEELGKILVFIMQLYYKINKHIDSSFKRKSIKIKQAFDNFLQLGNFYFKKNNYKKALKCFKYHSKLLFKDDANISIKKIECYIFNNKFNRAIDELKKLENQNPDIDYENIDDYKDWISIYLSIAYLGQAKIHTNNKSFDEASSYAFKVINSSLKKNNISTIKLKTADFNLDQNTHDYKLTLGLFLYTKAQYVIQIQRGDMSVHNTIKKFIAKSFRLYKGLTHNEQKLIDKYIDFLFYYDNDINLSLKTSQNKAKTNVNKLTTYLKENSLNNLIAKLNFDEAYENEGNDEIDDIEDGADNDENLTVINNDQHGDYEVIILLKSKDIDKDIKVFYLENKFSQRRNIEILKKALAHAKEYARQSKKDNFDDKLQKIIEKANQSGFDFSEILNDLQIKLNDDEKKTFKDIVKKIKSESNDKKEIDFPERKQDEKLLLSLLQKNTFVYIYGEAAVGKTTFVHNVMEKHYKKTHNTIWFNAESSNTLENNYTEIAVEQDFIVHVFGHTLSDITKNSRDTLLNKSKIKPIVMIFDNIKSLEIVDDFLNNTIFDLNNYNSENRCIFIIQNKHFGKIPSIYLTNLKYEPRDEFFPDHLKEQKENIIEISHNNPLCIDLLVSYFKKNKNSFSLINLFSTNYSQPLNDINLLIDRCIKICIDNLIKKSNEMKIKDIEKYLLKLALLDTNNIHIDIIENNKIFLEDFIKLIDGSFIKTIKFGDEQRYVMHTSIKNYILNNFSAKSHNGVICFTELTEELFKLYYESHNDPKNSQYLISHIHFLMNHAEIFNGYANIGPNYKAIINDSYAILSALINIITHNIYGKPNLEHSKNALFKIDKNLKEMLIKKANYQDEYGIRQFLYKSILLRRSIGYAYFDKNNSFLAKIYLYSSLIYNLLHERGYETRSYFHIAISYRDMAQFLVNYGQYNSALVYANMSLSYLEQEADKRKNNYYQIEIAVALGIIGTCYFNLGYYDFAESVFAHSLNKKKKIFRSLHNEFHEKTNTEIEITRCNLYLVRCILGGASKDRSKLESCAEYFRKRFGRHSNHYIISIIKLALVYFSDAINSNDNSHIYNSIDKADKLCFEAYDLYKKQENIDNSHFIRLLLLYAEIKLFKFMLENDRVSFISTDKKNSSLLYLNETNNNIHILNGAIDLLKDAYDKGCMLYKKENLPRAVAHYIPINLFFPQNIVVITNDIKQYSELFSKLLYICKSIYGDSHPIIARRYYDLGRIYRYNQKELSRKFFNYAYMILKKQPIDFDENIFPKELLADIINNDTTSSSQTVSYNIYQFDSILNNISLHQITDKILNEKEFISIKDTLKFIDEYKSYLKQKIEKINDYQILDKLSKYFRAIDDSYIKDINIMKSNLAMKCNIFGLLALLYYQRAKYYKTISYLQQYFTSILNETEYLTKENYTISNRLNEFMVLIGYAWKELGHEDTYEIFNQLSSNNIWKRAFKFNIDKKINPKIISLLENTNSSQMIKNKDGIKILDSNEGKGFICLPILNIIMHKVNETFENDKYLEVEKSLEIIKKYLLWSLHIHEKLYKYNKTEYLKLFEIYFALGLVECFEKKYIIAVYYFKQCVGIKSYLEVSQIVEEYQDKLEKYKEQIEKIRTNLCEEITEKENYKESRHYLFEIFDILKSIIIKNNSSTIYGSQYATNEGQLRKNLKKKLKNIQKSLDKNPYQKRAFYKIHNLAKDLNYDLRAIGGGSRSLFYEVCRYGDMNILGSIKENTSNEDLKLLINQPANDGWRLIILAAFMNYYDLAEWLVINGAEVNVHVRMEKINLGNRDEETAAIYECYIKTPLYFAVKNQNLKLIKLLLKYGADVDKILNEGLTVFHMALDQIVFFSMENNNQSSEEFKLSNKIFKYLIKNTPEPLLYKLYTYKYGRYNTSLFDELIKCNQVNYVNNLLESVGIKRIYRQDFDEKVILNIQPFVLKFFETSFGRYPIQIARTKEMYQILFKEYINEIYNSKYSDIFNNDYYFNELKEKFDKVKLDTFVILYVLAFKDLKRIFIDSKVDEYLKQKYIVNRILRLSLSMNDESCCYIANYILTHEKYGYLVEYNNEFYGSNPLYQAVFGGNKANLAMLLKDVKLRTGEIYNLCFTQINQWSLLMLTVWRNYENSHKEIFDLLLGLDIEQKDVEEENDSYLWFNSGTQFLNSAYIDHSNSQNETALYLALVSNNYYFVDKLLEKKAHVLPHISQSNNNSLMYTQTLYTVVHTHSNNIFDKIIMYLDNEYPEWYNIKFEEYKQSPLHEVAISKNAMQKIKCFKGKISSLVYSANYRDPYDMIIYNPQLGDTFHDRFKMANRIYESLRNVLNNKTDSSNIHSFNKIQSVSKRTSSTAFPQEHNYNIEHRAKKHKLGFFSQPKHDDEMEATFIDMDDAIVYGKINNVEVTFERHETEGDGQCGIYALPIPNANALYDLLIKVIKDTNNQDRNVCLNIIGEDILHLATSNSLNTENKILSEISNLSQEYLESSEEDSERKRKELLKKCQTAKVCLAYIKTDLKQRDWISIGVMKA